MHKLKEKFNKMSFTCYVPDCDSLGVKLKFGNRKVRVGVRERLKKEVEVLGKPSLTPAVLPEKNIFLHVNPNSQIVNETKNFSTESQCY